MKLIDILNLAFSNLKGNRLRTLLTVGGVTVGIGAIVFLVGLGYGLQQLTVNHITSQASLLVFDLSVAQSDLVKINDQLVQEVKNLDHIEKSAVSKTTPGQLELKEGAIAVKVLGIEENYLELNKLKPIKGSVSIKSGAIITESVGGSESKEKAVELIGETLKLSMFLPKDATPDSELERQEAEIKINSVVQGPYPQIYLPLQIFKDQGQKEYSTLQVLVDDLENVKATKTLLESKGFEVKSVAHLVDQIKSVFKIIQSVLGVFGFIALAVASIGMFNTMTIALLERTRDIGIMKAIGARKRDIWLVFLMEAITIGASGGILGIICGIGVGQALTILVNKLAGYSGEKFLQIYAVPQEFLIYVLIFSAVVGFFTGVYPARRAARLNPLDALRYE